MNVQSMVAASPDGKHICSAYQDIDCIEIYTDDFNSLIRLNGPDRITQKLTVTETPIGPSASLKPSNNTFNSLSASEKGFIVGYIGKTPQEDNSTLIQDLLYFDWSGKCLKCFHLPEGVVYLDIDWENGRMFGVTGGDEPKLVTAKIDLS